MFRIIVLALSIAKSFASDDDYDYDEGQGFTDRVVGPCPVRDLESFLGPGPVWVRGSLLKITTMMKITSKLVLTSGTWKNTQD